MWKGIAHTGVLLWALGIAIKFGSTKSRNQLRVRQQLLVPGNHGAGRWGEAQSRRLGNARFVSHNASALCALHLRL